MMNPSLALALLLVVVGSAAVARPLGYERSDPPLELTFDVVGGHYSGVVTGGNLFLQTDIPSAPLVKWSKAEPGKFYVLLMIDFDGNARGSWPDRVAPGKNAPLRHWIVGNLPGALLRGRGYAEGAKNRDVAVLQPYRAPHIPVVSDRFGVYLFEQPGRMAFAPVTGPITNFDVTGFLRTHRLGRPVASNFFVAVYTSESPFSGRPFHGNDVSRTWRKDAGEGKLAPLR